VEPMSISERRYIAALEDERNDLRSENVDLCAERDALRTENARLTAELKEQTERANSLEWQLGQYDDGLI
jgi:hypothetical protein